MNIIDTLSDDCVRASIQSAALDSAALNTFRTNFLNVINKRAPPIDLMKDFLSNEEKWTVGLILCYLVDMQYGVNNLEQILPVISVSKPAVNRFALKFIGCVRSFFPSQIRHDKNISIFLEDNVVIIRSKVDLILEMISSNISGNLGEQVPGASADVLTNHHGVSETIVDTKYDFHDDNLSISRTNTMLVFTKRGV